MWQLHKGQSRIQAALEADTLRQAEDASLDDGTRLEEQIKKARGSNRKGATCHTCHVRRLVSTGLCTLERAHQLNPKHETPRYSTHTR